MISVADLKAHLHIETTADDLLLADYELAAVADFERDSGRYVGPPEVVTEHFSPSQPGDRVLLLKDPALLEDPSASPAIAAPLVEELSGTAYTTVDMADYTVEGDRVIHLDGFWPCGFRAVRVTYWRGYAAGEEPSDVRHAVKELVGHKYRNREATGEDEMKETPLSYANTVQKYHKVRV